MKALEWLAKGRKTDDPINAFADFWRGFNNLYSSVGKGQELERERITRYLKNKTSESIAQQILSANREKIDYLISQPVIDMRGNGRDTSKNIATFKATTESINKLNELFMIIYQIRCNLEHGHKSPNRERDVQLCQCAAPIVAEVVQRTS